jgi:hypothetical protein
MNMNIALTLPKTRKQTIGSTMLARLRSRIAARVGRARFVQERERPYSFLSECECPHDCLRDHENE